MAWPQIRFHFVQWNGLPGGNEGVPEANTSGRLISVVLIALGDRAIVWRTEAGNATAAKPWCASTPEVDHAWRKA